MVGYGQGVAGVRGYGKRWEEKSTVPTLVAGYRPVARARGGEFGSGGCERL